MGTTRTGIFAFFNRRGQTVRLACALSAIGVAFSGNLHAATSAATVSATVVTPIAVAVSDSQLSQSDLATGQLTIIAGGVLTYSVAVQSASNHPADGVLKTGTQTLPVAASLTEELGGVAGPEVPSISVMIAYD